MMGTANFSSEFVRCENKFTSFSRFSTNPIVEPIFFVLGSPGTFSEMKNAAQQGVQILHNLTPEIVAARPATAGSSAINLERVAEFAPGLAHSQSQIHKLLSDLATMHLHGVFSPFDSHLVKVRTDAARAVVITDNIDPMLPALAPMLGSEQPRKYLIAFQNPAEARGTGGIIGAYAIVSADKGRIKIDHVGPDTEFIPANSVPISMPQDFQTLYGEDPSIWQNSNLSPNFPDAAKIWLALWKKQSGQSLDGVIALDPYLLKQVLLVAGPLQVDRQEITANNVIAQTLSLNYIRYANDNTARKEFLVAILKAALNRMLHFHLSASNLLTIFSNPVKENRIDLYSAHQSEQQFIESTSLSHLLPLKRDNSYRLIINNTAGNKMDYYLARSVTIASESCGKSPTTRVDFTLENTVKINEKLPSYVVGRLDLQKPRGDANSTSVEAMLFGPVGSQILGAEDVATGQSPGVQSTENSHPVLVSSLELKPGVPVHIAVEFSGGVGPLENIVQPLVNDEKVSITDRCSR